MAWARCACGHDDGNQVKSAAVACAPPAASAQRSQPAARRASRGSGAAPAAPPNAHDSTTSAQGLTQGARWERSGQARGRALSATCLRVLLHQLLLQRTLHVPQLQLLARQKAARLLRRLRLHLHSHARAHAFDALPISARSTRVTSLLSAMRGAGCDAAGADAQRELGKGPEAAPPTPHPSDVVDDSLEASEVLQVGAAVPRAVRVRVAHPLDEELLAGPGVARVKLHALGVPARHASPHITTHHHTSSVRQSSTHTRRATHDECAQAVGSQPRAPTCCGQPAGSDAGQTVYSWRRRAAVSCSTHTARSSATRHVSATQMSSRQAAPRKTTTTAASTPRAAPVRQHALHLVVARPVERSDGLALAPAAPLAADAAAAPPAAAAAALRVLLVVVVLLLGVRDAPGGRALALPLLRPAAAAAAAAAAALAVGAGRRRAPAAAGRPPERAAEVGSGLGLGRGGGGGRLLRGRALRERSGGGHVGRWC